jgi:hypothetical protein
MITASEARRKSTEVVNQKIATETTKIRQDIDKAISKGEFQIEYRGTLQQQTINMLVDLGYIVSTETTPTIISWYKRVGGV